LGRHDAPVVTDESENKSDSESEGSESSEDLSSDDESLDCDVSHGSPLKAPANEGLSLEAALGATVDRAGAEAVIKRVRSTSKSKKSLFDAAIKRLGFPAVADKVSDTTKKEIHESEPLLTADVPTKASSIRKSSLSARSFGNKKSMFQAVLDTTHGVQASVPERAGDIGSSPAPVVIQADKSSAATTRMGIDRTLKDAELKHEGADVPPQPSIAVRSNQKVTKSPLPTDAREPQAAAVRLQATSVTTKPDLPVQPSSDEKAAAKDKAMARLERMKMKAIKSANRELGVNSNDLADALGISPAEAREPQAAAVRLQATSVTTKPDLPVQPSSDEKAAAKDKAMARLERMKMKAPSGY
jgi:hypothetical protein